MAENIPLQHRAGFNYPSLLGVLSALRGDGIKLASSTFTLLEGSDKEIRIPGAVSLLAPGGFVTIYNETGAGITAQLWLVLADGSATQLGADVIIADGANDDFASFSYAPSEGERLELRISSGSVTAQDGVRVQWSWTVVEKTYINLLEASRRLTSTTFEITGVEGVGGILAGFFMNFSATPINYTVKRVWPDGFEEEIDTGTLGASGAADSGQQVTTGVTLNDDWKLLVEFDSLPASGFIWAQQALVTGANMAAQDW
jgi:hypothetical protein